MAKGWIKLHRELKDHPIWNDKPFSKGQAWVDLLLSVNHEPKKIMFDGELIELQSGQFITSYLKLSEAWGWSRGKTTRFLNMLKTDTMIDIKRTGNGQLITIVNWALYQGVRATDDTTNGHQNEQPTDNRRTQTRIYKNNKEGKNSSPLDPEALAYIEEMIAKEEMEKNGSN